MGPPGVPVVLVDAVCEPPVVRVPTASAVADEGTAGLCSVGERRTNVRGGRTFQAAGICGGLAPLAGRGGGGEVRPPTPATAVAQPADALGAQAAVRSERVAWVPGLPPVERRTAAPGGRPTVGMPGVATPARLMVGTPFGQAVREPAEPAPDVRADVVPAAAPGAAYRRPRRQRSGSLSRCRLSRWSRRSGTSSGLPTRVQRPSSCHRPLPRSSCADAAPAGMPKGSRCHRPNPPSARSPETSCAARSPGRRAARRPRPAVRRHRRRSRPTRQRRWRAGSRRALRRHRWAARSCRGGRGPGSPTRNRARGWRAGRSSVRCPVRVRRRACGCARRGGGRCRAGGSRRCRRLRRNRSGRGPRPRRVRPGVPGHPRSVRAGSRRTTGAPASPTRPRSMPTRRRRCRRGSRTCSTRAWSASWTVRSP